ncbi:MAG TPA: carboxypeptidase regulatory-like domain-containing protein [Candidatus Binataceae bacterium]|nr:carboxypeptidase regulatory-like domain-containing protein [Candidatus Binataceae bacterium]
MTSREFTATSFFEGSINHAMILKALAIAALTVALMLLAIEAEGGAYTGNVVRDQSGRPVAGAIVTLTDQRLGRATSVYTASDGSFTMPELAPGRYDLRVRRAGYEDLSQSGIAITSQPRAMQLAMTIVTDPNELAWQLPANRWTPLVLERLSSDTRREEFVRQCAYCHQQGSWATRVQRSDEDWRAVFIKMGRMGGTISPELQKELPGAFNTAYEEKNYLHKLTEPEFVPPPAPEGLALKATITEWSMGAPTSMLHDIVVHPDGSIWSVDTNGDRLLRLDPKTNAREEFPIPVGDSPIGGVFHSTGLLQSPGATARVAPHSLQVAQDGTIWVTLCLGDKVGHLDPHTRHWTIYTQKEGLYPHTLRIDGKGRVWYTLAVSNGVGMIDPSTGEQRVYRLPAANFSQAIALRMMPLAMWATEKFGIAPPTIGEGAPLPVPYGIDIAPDGGVWFSQLNAHRIGRIDPESGAIRTVETPFAGPRRLRFDSKGNLWVPGFSSNLIARYTPSTGQFKTWAMPTGGTETPYALNVDRRTDTVWVCGTASDTLMSFNPATERFTVYPLPTRVTFTREIDFGKDGAIWTSNSDFPAWHIEAPSPTFIRIQPNAS